MDTVAGSDSILPVMLSITFLAAVLLAVGCYRSPSQRGDAVDSFLILSGLALIGGSAGFGLAFIARAGYARLGAYGPAFLVCILSGLIFTAIYAMRGR